MVQTIKISSCLHNVYNVEQFLNTIFKELAFTRKLYCRIYLAVLESVNNGIIHGNKKDNTKYVNIVFDETEEQYIFNIEDEGSGFSFVNLPDPRDIGNRNKESGRGIFIMKQYADKVNFTKNGACVQLIFNK